MKVTLNAARAAREAVQLYYSTGLEYGPELFTGSHEDLSDDQWVISWEYGSDYGWVYDETCREKMEVALQEYANSVPAFANGKVTFRVEAVNHWCMAIYADTHNEE